MRNITAYMRVRPMSIKYWEFEDAPLKEKLKSVSVKEVAKIFFDNETEAYRFATLILEVKRAKELRLKNVPKSIPIATAKRYLDYGVEIGMLKHESSAYMLTDRFSKPLRNIATYIKAWMESQDAEDLTIQFANARIEKQGKRGGVPGSAKAERSGSENTNPKE
jgi:hypothetical protein